MVGLFPIGLFDSGVGGLSVLRRLWELCPHEDYVYFADTYHMPYGPRSHAEIENIVFGICDFLLHRQCRAIVMACNTSSALVLPLARRHYPIPLFGVLMPGARTAVSLTSNGRIGVLATEATIRSKAYVNAVRSMAPNIEVFGQACGALAPFVERGELQGEHVVTAVSDCVAPLLDCGVDTLVLGCTHYPFLLPVLNEIVPPHVTLVDPAKATVQEVQAHLQPATSLTGSTTFFVSGGGQEFARVAKVLLGTAVHPQEVRFKVGAHR